jgi:phosphoglucomutase
MKCLNKGDKEMNYKKQYEYWINNPYFDEETKKELKNIENNEKEI